jgi:hypothetical protein
MRCKWACGENFNYKSKTKRGEKTMTRKKRLFVSAVGVLLGLLAISGTVLRTRRASAASPQGLDREETVTNAGAPCEFGLASLQGQYALVGTYGDHIAASFGQRYFDGNGNLAGTFLVNEPTAGSTTGARTIVTGTQKGTYTVNCNGTGVFTRTLTASTGVVTTQTDDFMITASKHFPQEGLRLLVATDLVDAQETPSAIVAGGAFLTRVYTRVSPY